MEGEAQQDVKRRRLLSRKHEYDPYESNIPRDPTHQELFRNRIASRWYKAQFCDVSLLAKASAETIKRKHELDFFPVHFPDDDGLVEVQVHSIVASSMSPQLFSMLSSWHDNHVQDEDEDDGNDQSSRNQTREQKQRDSSKRSTQAKRKVEDDQDRSGKPSGASKQKEMQRRKKPEMIRLLLDKSLVEAGALIRCVRYMYEGILDINADCITEVLQTSHYLGLEQAVQMCTQFLLQNLNPGNALSLGAIGKMFSCGDLEEKAESFVCENFVAITLGMEWLDLSREAVERLLQRNDLVCVSEIDIVCALYRWATSLIRGDSDGVFDEDGDEKMTSSWQASKAKPRSSTPRDVADDDDDEEEEEEDEESYNRKERAERIMAMKNFLQDGTVRLEHLSEAELQELKTGAFIKKARGTVVSAKNVDGITDEEKADLIKFCADTVDQELERRGKDPDNAERVSQLRKYDFVAGTRVTPHSCIAVLTGHEGYVYGLTQLDGHRIASGSRDQTIRIWDLNTMKCVKVIEGHNDRVFALKAFKNSAGRLLLASCSFDCTIRIWDANTFELVRVLKDHDGWVVTVNLCDGKLITGSADCTARVWNLDSLKCETVLKGHTDHIYSVLQLNVPTLGPVLATGSQDSSIRIWNPRDQWSHIRTLTGHKDSVRSLVQCENKLISCSSDRTVRIWDTSSWYCVGVLVGHAGVVESSAVVKDTKNKSFIATASRDNSIKIWDLDTKRCESTITGHRNWVKCMLSMSRDEASGETSHGSATTAIATTAADALTRSSRSSLGSSSLLISGSADCTIRVHQPFGTATTP